MRESFLHYIWQFQYFNKEALQTSDRNTLEVYAPGTLNSDGGPDFQSAKIKIGSIDWAGSVEIHIKASEWNDHLHFRDHAYDSVVLHVVWVNDKTVHRADGTPIPTLELKGRVQESLLLSYRKLIESANPIACHKLISTIDKIVVMSMLDFACVQRLETKAELILKSLANNNNDWQQTTFELLAKNFGFKINSEVFQQLARSLPYKYLLKQADSLVHIEALLFGQAGFLEWEVGDEYYLLLKREYSILKTKFSLETVIRKSQWKFLRLRPANFPTIRIAQFAAVAYSVQNIFSKLIELEEIRFIKQLFLKEQSGYWQHHYQFNKESKSAISPLGESSVETIIINSVVPLLAAYAKFSADQRLMDRAAAFLTQLRPESNAVVKKWSDLNINPSHAHDTQAMLELYNHFCIPKKCLSCRVGNAIIRPNV